MGEADDPLTIVALGDSTTAVDDWSGQRVEVYPDLLPGALAAFGLRARVVNAGIGGTTTRDAVERLDRDVRACSPYLVVVQFGINDSWIDIDEGRREPRLTRDEYRRNLRCLVRALRGDGAHVVLMTPNSMRWADPYYIDAFEKVPGLLDTGVERGLDALLDLYAQDARDVAREEAVPLVDVHRAFEEYGAEPEQAVGDLLLDGIHPSAAGQRLVCRTLAAQIAALVPAEDRVRRQAGAARPPDTLGLDAAQMRELGYWVVDRVVAHFEDVADGPSITTGSPADLRAALGGPPPELGGDPREALETLAGVALAHMQHGDHPRNFARVPGPSSYAGVLGDWMGTGFNAIAASWTGGSGPATVELVTLEWLRELLGLPEGTEGVMLSGGSMANITALAAARASVGPGVCYLSDQTHASIVRGLPALGFPVDDVRVLPSDGGLRLLVRALESAVRDDRAAGRRPAIVVASAGTTNTGAVDPLRQIAELCRAEDLWFHVDGAYGAAAALCEPGRRALEGLELADSLVVDPHKWLFQPYDLGCLLVRRPGALARAFHMSPDYLADVTAAGDEEVDLRDRSLELTRRARGLKLWLTFRIHGVARLREAVEHGIRLAEHAGRLIAADPRWAVVTPAQLGIVTFALRGAGHGELKRRADVLAADGFAHLTTTWVRDRPVLRLCIINPRTTEADVAETLRRLGVGAAGAAAPEKETP